MQAINLNFPMPMKSNNVKDILEQQLRLYGELSEDDITKGLDFFKLRLFKKEELLIKAGETCNWIFFIASGIVRNYYISNKGEAVTYCITFPMNFITAYSSFISGEKTFENIHALTDLEVLTIEKKHLNELNTSSHWLKFSKHFAEQSYVMMENRLLALQMESAQNRYAELLSKNPEFVQQVPLKYLSSYLGITQRHLSRLRKNIS